MSESALEAAGSGLRAALDPRGAAVPEARYLRACRRLPVDTTPVWFMRQAGRALPEYRAIRRRATLATCIADPALAAEITLLPVERLGVDAAIVFADITTPLTAIGAGVRLDDGVGPVVDRPIRTASAVEDLARLVEAAAGSTDQGVPAGGLFDSVATTIRLVRGATQVPVIGFAGGPFTLACYLVEGTSRRGAAAEFPTLRLLLRREPNVAERLLDSLTRLTSAYLRAQVAAGADSIMLFDSWVGGLSPADHQRFVRPRTARLVREVRALGVPVTVFGTNTAGLLADLASTEPDVVGLDWRIELDEGWRRVGPDRAIQGNLDPWLLLGPWAEVEAATRAILAAAAGRPGHVFNLGHGVLPTTDVDVLRRLVDLVHEVGLRGPAPVRRRSSRPAIPTSVP
jgi:uroporphyrinogen decarboxylase